MTKGYMSYVEWIRSKVGQRRIFIAFASIILQDEAGAVLLQRRGDNLHWELPGGSLERGESIQDCARRELFEETGMSAGNLHLVGLYSDPKYDHIFPNGDQVQQFNVCFSAEVEGGKPCRDGKESLDLKFFTPEAIPYNSMSNFYMDMLHHGLKRGEPVFEEPFSQVEITDQIEMICSIIGHEFYIGVGSTAVVVNNESKILMVKRTDNGLWSLPGGYMSLGENAAQAVIREVGEEAGLEIEVERLMGILSPVQAWQYPNGDCTQGVVAIFRAHPLGNEIRPDLIESSQVSWMAPIELLNLEEHPILMGFHKVVVDHLESGVFVV